MLTTVVRGATLTERTQQQLEQLILDRHLKPGDQLPPQDDLAEFLGVSRTVVREAVRHLTAKGLLEGKRGSGVYVRALSPDLLREPAELLLRCKALTRGQIVEARELLEVKIAGLAAERARQQDIEAMQETIRRMANGTLDASGHAATDVAFHQILAKAADNPLLLVMANSINDIMINLRFAYVNRYGLAQSTELSVQDHSRILDQVKARNVAGARRAMETHLGHTRKILAELEATIVEQKEQSFSTHSTVHSLPSEGLR
ncbi:MAG: FadR/GntR family transcriptional regulator [Acidobacteriota bacterium]